MLDLGRIRIEPASLFQRSKGVAIESVLAIQQTECRELIGIIRVEAFLTSGLRPSRKATRRRALTQARRDPAESKTPRMYRNSTRENREAQSPPADDKRRAGGGKR